MKLILITLVALVVGLMVACSSEPAPPTNTPPPAFSDEEVIGAVKGHLLGPGMEPYCEAYSRRGYLNAATVRQDPSNPDKYLVTGGMGGTWTFIGSLAKVIPTSTGPISVQGC